MNVRSKNKTILLIDDDRLLCESIRAHLANPQREVLVANRGDDGLRLCAQRRIDAVLLDQNLPDVEGHTLCSSILRCGEHTKIIFITAHPSFEVAVKAIRAGAHDYLAKPFELEELALTLEQALQTQDLEKAVQVGSYKIRKESEETVLIGSGRVFAEVRKLIALASTVDAPVLISGETGAGKSVVAKAIHYQNSACNEPFVSVNCSALSENLIEAELFGHEKGSFTGAIQSRKGLFEMAEGGTLFLDEIGEMPLHLQTKLLGVLEDKQIRRVGGESIFPVNVRIIGATCCELERTLDRSFRRDLYYRLSVIRIHLPPLRERAEDIPELCLYLLRKLANGRELRLSEVELARLAVYDWPGNVRELKNVLERAAILQKGPDLRPSELLYQLQPGSPQRTSSPGAPYELPLTALKDLEKDYIHFALQSMEGNYTRTSRALGISLSTLKRKIRTYRIKLAAH